MCAHQESNRFNSERLGISRKIVHAHSTESEKTSIDDESKPNEICEHNKACGIWYGSLINYGALNIGCRVS